VLLDAALKACAEKGAQTQILVLAGMEIKDCAGCIPCPKKCVTGDDTWDVTDRLWVRTASYLLPPVTAVRCPD